MDEQDVRPDAADLTVSLTPQDITMIPPVVLWPTNPVYIVDPLETGLVIDMASGFAWEESP